ncbi:MAG TPA: ATP-binding protein [Candidatus Eisenbacteria bacterium]|nr:ATP-binding protein [Candidatus Eisenbacteria bacterium]
MRSLRSRIIVGSALVALIPLALATLVLSGKLESMVRAQSEERLSASLDALQGRLRADGDRIARQVRILGNDPTLKRLYLVRQGGGRDLAEHAAERRVLLGLDFLAVHGPDGVQVAGDFSTDVGSRGISISRGAPIVYEGRPVGSVVGGLAVDSTLLAAWKRAGGVDLTLRDGDGAVLASTVEAAAESMADSALVTSGVARVRVGRSSFLAKSAPLGAEGPRAARITAMVSTSAMDGAIAALRVTAVVTGAAGLVLAVLLGTLGSSQISGPVERLSAFSRRMAQGEWDEPLRMESVRELESLVDALERMRQDLTTYRERLVTSERQAAWSQMARAVAHEVKNPLTPIAVSVADLKRSYDAKREDFPEILDQSVRTISEEIHALERLLREFSDFARLPEPRLAPVKVADLWGDLRTLYGRETEAGRLRFDPAGSDLVFSADPDQVRQALVNLLRNGFEAGGGATVSVSAARANGLVTLSVSDTGPGLAAEQRARLFTPGFTTKPAGSGLGLTVVQRIVHDHRGTIDVESVPGLGTTFHLSFPTEPEAPPCPPS